MSGKQLPGLTVDLTRAGSRVLVIAGKRLLADRQAMPPGPERMALEKAVADIERERNAPRYIERTPPRRPPRRSR